MRKFLWIFGISFLFSTAAFSNPSLGSLTLSETQYWVYKFEGSQLSFNNPWDEQEGDAIKRDTLDLPPHTAPCVALSLRALEETLKDPSIAGTLEQLVAKGASKELVFLVNVVPAGSSRNELRKLDRDAYFSHWNSLEERPHLAMSNYKNGQWLWEVIAATDSCLQPDPREVFRYLNYALQRLSMP